MKRFHPVFCMLSMSTLGLLPAQDEVLQPAPVPSGPLVQTRAPDFAKWVVTQKQKQGSPDAGVPTDTSAPVEQKSVDVLVITTTKTGAIKMREMVNAKGATWQTWCTGSLQITVQPGTDTISLARGKSASGDPTPFYVDYSRSDFPEMDIVSAKNYAGVQNAYNTKCLVFKAVASPFRGAAPVGNIAYVDLKTRLPVAFTAGGSEWTYQFLAAPTDQLSVPPQVQKIIQMEQQLAHPGASH